MFIPHTKQDIEKMLAVCGFPTVEDLYKAATGMEPLREDDFLLPPGLDVVKLSRHLEELAGKNSAHKKACFCGGGAYRHFVHPAVDFMIARSEFLTAYTPYQPELSQGTLQSIFEFQTMAASLLGMDVANASMYDGASAAAEAVLMAVRMTGKERVVVSEALHPEYRETIRGYLEAGGYFLVEAAFDPARGTTLLEDLASKTGNNTAAVVMGYPNFFGIVEDLEEASKIAHAAGALLLAVTAEGVALGLLEAPGKLGADIAVCEGISLGLPMSFGGPGVGLFGCSRNCIKQMPGRLVGQTTDADGKVAYVLTLAMREQHIRRERATSNICTNHNLCALAVAMHLSLLGPEGFRKQAEICAHKARILAEKVANTSAARRGTITPALSGPFFNEIVFRVRGMTPQNLVEALSERGLLVGPPIGRWYDSLKDCLLIAATECSTNEEMEALASSLEEIL